MNETPGIKPIQLLIDGYNVVAPVAPPRNPGSRTGPSATTGNEHWLQRERMQLLARLARHLDPDLCGRTCVVFDANDPPRDRPSQFRIHGIDVRFAVDHPEADDLIEEIIAGHSVPKTLTVVSSDHRVQAAAKRRGATPVDSQPWLDDLVDGKWRLVGEPAASSDPPSIDKPEVQDADDVNAWLREFGFKDPHE